MRKIRCGDAEHRVDNKCAVTAFWLMCHSGADPILRERTERSNRSPDERSDIRDSDPSRMSLRSCGLLATERFSPHRLDS